MDAFPVLVRIAQLLHRHGLEAILIGNAAAALRGAPVTTVDLDFLFRKTPANLKKLKAIAAELDAVILKPYYPGQRTVPNRARSGWHATRFHDGHGWNQFLRGPSKTRGACEFRQWGTSGRRAG